LALLKVTTANRLYFHTPGKWFLYCRKHLIVVDNHPILGLTMNELLQKGVGLNRPLHRDLHDVLFGLAILGLINLSNSDKLRKPFTHIIFGFQLLFVL
jgi:hypothetical protein